MTSPTDQRSNLTVTLPSYYNGNLTTDIGLYRPITK